MVYQEDEEQILRNTARRVKKYIGCEDGESVDGIMPHKLFKTLNAESETPITEERYKARPVVDLKTLRDTKKRAGETLAAKGWENYKKLRQEVCETAGRIMTFNDFFKQNGKFMEVRRLKKGDAWKQYNQAWDALCGTVLKRITGPKEGKKTEEEEPAAADATEAADAPETADATEAASDEQESASTNLDEEEEELCARVDLAHPLRLGAPD